MVLYDTATRAQALTLKLAGFSNDQVQQITGIHPRTVLLILDRAVERGLDLAKPVILDIHVQDAPRSGRPSKQADVKEDILQKVRRDRMASPPDRWPSQDKADKKAGPNSRDEKGTPRVVPRTRTLELGGLEEGYLVG
ncbi:hypothetical protein MKX08_000169 [Trichoderma sp. CBMAI-0020]|nr:hypothetical protein MKX08_000169 [Trichoderma sp. CBMAI-0020]